MASTYIIKCPCCGQKFPNESKHVVWMTPSWGWVDLCPDVLVDVAFECPWCHGKFSMDCRFTLADVSYDTVELGGHEDRVNF